MKNSVFYSLITSSKEKLIDHVPSCTLGMNRLKNMKSWLTYVSSNFSSTFRLHISEVNKHNQIQKKYQKK